MENSVGLSSVKVRIVTSRQDWDPLVENLGGNPFQLWGWGEVKSITGSWTALRLAVENADGVVVGGAQVLLRDLPFPFRQLAYVPRGPFGEDQNLTAVADAVTRYVGAHTPSVSITFEPNIDEATRFEPEGGIPAATDILLPSTLIVDLRPGDAKIMADMGKKTRSYVRRSLRQGVVVKRVKTEEQLQQCLDIYEETAKRADFPLHTHDYYRLVREELGDNSPIYLAYWHGEPVAFLWLASTPSTAVELYGGANEVGLKNRVNYGLKWEAMLDQKALGVRNYDLNGLLGEGISQFKTGFASHVNQLHGGVEVPLNWLHPVWVRLLPTARETFNTGRAKFRHFKEVLQSKLA